MKQYTARAYNRFSNDPVKSIIYKSSDTERLLDEINYYKKIHNTSLSCFFPRIFSSTIDISNDRYVLGIEQYGYSNLASFNGSWDDVAEKLRCILELFKSYSLEKDIDVIKYKKEMYYNKTIYYHEELIKKFPTFDGINNKEYIKVNGQLLYTFDVIWSDVERMIDQLLINNNRFSIIHGDLCFSNILYDGRNDIVKLIDPRGSFGAKGIYGDPLYDVAKLIHSFSGLYEYIIYDKFNISYNVDHIQYSFINNNHIFIKEAFLNHQIFNDIRAKLIEGLIFISMCSRHYDSIDRQILMYVTGLKILNELLIK